MGVFAMLCRCLPMSMLNLGVSRDSLPPTTRSLVGIGGGCSSAFHPRPPSYLSLFILHLRVSEFLLRFRKGGEEVRDGLMCLGKSRFVCKKVFYCLDLFFWFDFYFFCVSGRDYYFFVFFLCCFCLSFTNFDFSSCSCSCDVIFPLLFSVHLRVF